MYHHIAYFVCVRFAFIVFVVVAAVVAAVIIIIIVRRRMCAGLFMFPHRGVAR